MKNIKKVFFVICKKLRTRKKTKNIVTKFKIKKIKQKCEEKNMISDEGEGGSHFQIFLMRGEGGG